jgi:hypothetical protein
MQRSGAAGNVTGMPMLSAMIRNVAITGSSDHITAWCADRQGGAWAERTVRSAFPDSHGRHRPPDARLRELESLQASGVLTEAEANLLRSRLHM